MKTEGACGWFAFALAAVILMAPALVGVILGREGVPGRRARLGLAGALINGLILAGYTTVATFNLATP